MPMLKSLLITMTLVCISACAPANRGDLLNRSNESNQNAYNGTSKELHQKLIDFSNCMKNEEIGMNVAGGIIGGGLWGGIGAASAPRDLYVVEENFSEITQAGEVYYLTKPSNKTFYRFGLVHSIINGQVTWRAYSGGGYWSNIDKKVKKFIMNGNC